MATSDISKAELSDALPDTAEPGSLPAVPLAAIFAVTAVIIVVAGLLVYHKKRRRSQSS
jgi:uncharacterized protein (DUF2062 family)